MKKSHKTLILETLQEHPEGLTRDDISIYTCLSLTAISKRVSDLKLDGKVKQRLDKIKLLPKSAWEKNKSKERKKRFERWLARGIKRYGVTNTQLGEIASAFKNNVHQPDIFDGQITNKIFTEIIETINIWKRQYNLNLLSSSISFIPEHEMTFSIRCTDKQSYVKLGELVTILKTGFRVKVENSRHIACTVIEVTQKL